MKREYYIADGQVSYPWIVTGAGTHEKKRGFVYETARLGVFASLEQAEAEINRYAALPGVAEDAGSCGAFILAGAICRWVPKGDFTPKINQEGRMALSPGELNTRALGGEMTAIKSYERSVWYHKSYDDRWNFCAAPLRCEDVALQIGVGGGAYFTMKYKPATLFEVLEEYGEPADTDTEWLAFYRGAAADYVWGTEKRRVYDAAKEGVALPEAKKPANPYSGHLADKWDAGLRNGATWANHA